MQQWSCETLEIISQNLFHLFYSIQFICATVRLLKFFHKILFIYTIVCNSLCNNEVVKLLKWFHKLFFSLFYSIQLIYATVNLWDSWIFLTNNFSFTLQFAIHLWNCEAVRPLKLCHKIYFIYFVVCSKDCPVKNFTDPKICFY